jgi:hypothetical protein
LASRSVRRFRTGWLTGGLHLFILWMAFEAESSEAWPYALGAMSVVSFFAWMANYRRYRQVHDVPTSKVASAAQGYVEFFGRAAPMPESTLKAPISDQPCCWFSYCIESRTSDDKWETVESGESVEHFRLIDDTGECVIAPDGAEILYTQHKCWTEGDRRYTEELLLPERNLYALGQLRTTNAASLAHEESKAVGHLLAAWKKDEKTLLERFDTDKSGKLDLTEWEAARLAAQREVRKKRLRSIEGVHVLSKPADGRVFIIAGGLPERIGRRFALWSGAHLIFFFGAGIASLLLFGSAPPAPAPGS